MQWPGIGVVGGAIHVSDYRLCPTHLPCLCFLPFHFALLIVSILIPPFFFYFYSFIFYFYLCFYAFYFYLFVIYCLWLMNVVSCRLSGSRRFHSHWRAFLSRGTLWCTALFFMGMSCCCSSLSRPWS